MVFYQWEPIGYLGEEVTMVTSQTFQDKARARAAAEYDAAHSTVKYASKRMLGAKQKIHLRKPCKSDLTYRASKADEWEGWGAPVKRGTVCGMRYQTRVSVLVERGASMDELAREMVAEYPLLEQGIIAPVPF